MSLFTDKKNSQSMAFGISFGIIIGGLLFAGGSYFFNQETTRQANDMPAKKQPLYWVAPMDANYRRDKPGKSPMGMDLVPVYENANMAQDEGAGTIYIAPNVINNLGVRTSIASFQALHTEINTVGYVTYDEDKLVHIHPRVQGWIETLYLKSVGDPVTQGQALYDIYSPELVNAQEELLLAIERKNSRLISAAENRLSALQLPKSAIDKLKSTKKVQQSITFHAPQNGVVENLKIREGFFVKPGSTLMSIGDLSEVWVEAEIFERQAGQVSVGTLATMSLDYLPGKIWQGEVDFIYPTLDAKTRTVKVRLRFNNKNGLFKPNMFAQITLHTTGAERALVIPKEALIRTGDQDRVVLALGEGRYKSVAVNAGRFDRQHVEIISGITEGEQVVSSAQFLLDSESSKTSDFKRMSVEPESQHDQEQVDTQVSRATVTGTVNSLMIDHGMVNISRAAIEKWSRPAATMDFIAANGVSLSEVSVGMEVTFTFEIHDDNFVIIDISPLVDAHNAHENH